MERRSRYLGSATSDATSEQADGQRICWISPCWMRADLLELQAAVSARAGDQRQSAGASWALRSVEVDLWQLLPRELVPPVLAHHFGDPRQLVLLDQEVRLGPSTLAGARRTTHEDGDPRGQTAIAQVLHLGDRSGHRRHEGEAVQKILSLGSGQRFHGSFLARFAPERDEFVTRQPRQRNTARPRSLGSGRCDVGESARRRVQEHPKIPSMLGPVGHADDLQVSIRR